jgi:nitrogen regulatory protein PII
MDKYLVIVTIDDLDLLEDVLSAWEAVGVTGATVFETSGMGRVATGGLRDDMPLLPRLSDFIQVRHESSRTIFSVVGDEDMVDAMVEAAQRIVGDFNQPNTGILYVLPVLRAYGLDRK